MNPNAQNREQRSSREANAEVVPAFKPVALPALAAAMRSARPQQSQPKETALPAILRKEAVLSR
jgi:hypothetical protein